MENETNSVSLKEHVCVCVCVCLIWFFRTEQYNKMQCQCSSQRPYPVETSLYQGPLSLRERHS